MKIRTRNIKRDENGVILSGSATLVKNQYKRNAKGDHTKNHSQQVVIERLGRVLWLDPNDKGRGIFASPDRGLVLYDLSKDKFTPVEPTDERLAGTKYEYTPARIHTSFGNFYLFFSEMEKTVFMRVLRETFGNDRILYEKVLAHIFHDCMKNGSYVKCGEYLSYSALSYLLNNIPVSTLDCDSSYFNALADDNLKTAFFTNLVTEMRKVNPDFGRACYVDSTPLPGEAQNNPFNALASHGTDGAVIQSRLVLILDIQSSIPVWFEIIPANVLDKSTILSITNDVKATLNIDIDMYDLDAGYSRQELFELFNRGNSTYPDSEGITRDHTLLMRMPSGNGYHRDELYVQCKQDFYKGKYSFDYEHHTFFGKRIEVDLFGYPENAFVFVDKTQAESLLRNWRQEHLEEWNALTESEQDWYQVKDGFFMLVGNKDQSPAQALAEYRGRTHIESFFRDGKTYLKILPLGKWNRETVKGKIFHDMMEVMIYRAYRKQVAPAGMTMSSLNVCLDSWECFLTDGDLLELKTPKVQVREVMESLGYDVPAHIYLHDLRSEIFEGIPMDRTPVTVRTKRNTKKEAQLSPDEKLEQKEQKRIQKIKDAAEQKMTKAVESAERQKERAVKKAEATLEKAKTRAQSQMEKAVTAAKREQTKGKAFTAYKQKVADAEEKYQMAVKSAEQTYDQAVIEAKTVCEQEKAAAEQSSADESEGKHSGDPS